MSAVRYQTFYRFALLALILLFLGGKVEAQPWVQSFTPLRTFYVSPTGTGSGNSQSNPMSLTTAMNQALPGDLYWLTAANYNGTKTFNRAGTASNPIVWRGIAGGGAIIVGSINLASAHNWVWGLEVKDPNLIGTTEGIVLNAAGGHVINCNVHDIKGRVGIAAWATGSGQVLYGNIIYEQIPNSNNPHNIYTQNDFATHGYKYIVGNMVLDAWDATPNTYNFHAYTQGGSISGFHAEKNILKRGKFLIGGTNLPADREIVKNNYFWNAPVNFGYSRPAQIEFTNNYLGRSNLWSEFFWGVGEVQYPQNAQSIFTGNEFHKPSGNHFDFRTSAFLGSGQCNGCPKIRSGDSWNNNTYSSPFAATFFADNNNQGSVTFSEWQTYTANAGKAFDTNSTVASTSPNKIGVIPNEYEAGRGHIAIFNWSLASSVSVDLSSILANGANFQVLDPRNMGSPILTGTYSAPVNIPTGGAEFLALLVVTTSAPPPPTDTTPPETTITSSVCGTTVGTSSVNITWTGSDNVTPTGSLVYAYALDAGAYSSYGSATSNTFNNLTNGSHTVSVKAKDQAGNVDPTPAQCSFTVNVADTTPPETTITSSVCGTTVGTSSVNITWTGSDNVTPTGSLVYAYALDAGAYSSYGSATSNTFNNLTNGSHTVSVKAKDQAGNVDPTPAQCSFTVNVADTTPPETTITSSVCGTTVGTSSVNITWTGSDNVTPIGSLVYAYALDAGAYSSYGSATSNTFNNLTNGSHTVSVKAKDQAGNVDPTPAQCSFTVNVADTTPPIISNIQVSGIGQTSATVTWDTDEMSDTQVEYGTSPCPCSQNSALNPNLTTAHSVLLTGLSAGTTYHYRVKSRDASGNLAISSDRTFATGQNPPPPPSNVNTCLEAEAGSLAGEMKKDTDTSASNHSKVQSSVQDEGTVSFTLDILVSGTYVIWARVKAEQGDQDSFYVSADGGTEDIFDVALGNYSESFQWSRVNGRNGGAPGSLDPRTFSFTAGQHTLVFRGREPKTVLDMILVTNDLNYVPTSSSSNSFLYKIKIGPKKFTSTTAKVKWRSEDPADTQVEFGTTSQYGNVSELKTSMVTKHNVLLENLQPNTTYHYRVRSIDGNGNLWISSDFKFTTLP
jgi:hypothetical protein